MIYYPLSTLMLAGFRDILIISTPADLPNFERLIAGNCCVMILGDNVFYGNGLTKIFNRATMNAKAGKATIFGYNVNDPERFGIMELDEAWNVLSVEEKPKKPRSNAILSGSIFLTNG